MQGGRIESAVRAVVQDAGAIEVNDARVVAAVMALATAQVAADEANEAVRCCTAHLRELCGVSIAG